MPQQSLSPDRREPPTGGDPAMPRPPGAVRRFWRRHPWWVDSILAGLYLVIGVFAILSVFLATGVSRPGWQLAVLLIGSAIATGALLVRRRHPWLTFTVLWVIAIVFVLFDGGLDAFGLSLALYSIAVYSSIGGAWIAFAGSAFVGCAAALGAQFILFARADDGLAGDRIAAASFVSGLFVLLTLIATLVGTNVGGRRRYVGALVDRAAQLARERDQQARLATAAERARITREMHDVVAHSLSIMVSLSDGADALADTEPERTREAIREIGDVGRRSLVDMRRLLGVLRSGDVDGSREDEAPLHPQPGTDELPELVATFRTAGLPVVVQAHGEPPVGEGVRTAIYRVVQEALTNALRYSADPSAVTVNLDYGGGGAEVTVTDDGRARQARVPSMGSGQGLVGMRERAALYGGSMDAGPGHDGGWRVQVTFPQAKDDE